MIATSTIVRIAIALVAKMGTEPVAILAQAAADLDYIAKSTSPVDAHRLHLLAKMLRNEDLP